MNERVRQLMAQVLQTPMESIDLQTRQEDVEAWDSLGHMNLCLALEEEFGVKFGDHHVIEMTDVGTIVSTVADLTSN